MLHLPLKSFLAVCLALVFAVGARAESERNPLVAVIGAGPAGVSLAHRLAQQGAHVVVFDREKSFGGGILSSYYWRKNGRKTTKLRQYARELDGPNIDYVGGIEISSTGLLHRPDLIELGFSAVFNTVGATIDNSLDIPGQEYAIPTSHASNHYNGVWTGKSYPAPQVGKRVAVIGAGASAGDVSRWVLEDHPEVEEFYLLVRRSPSDGLERMTHRHFSIFWNFLDLDDFKREVYRYRDHLARAGTTPEAFLEKWLTLGESDRNPGGLPIKGTKRSIVKIRFLWAPTRIEKGEGGLTLTSEEQIPVFDEAGNYSLQGTGLTHALEVDSVLSIIGMHVDPTGLDLPTQAGRFRVKADVRGGSRPVDKYLLDVDEAVPAFVFGWAQRPQGSDRDHEAVAENVARLTLEHIRSAPAARLYDPEETQAIRQRLYQRVTSSGRDVFLRMPGAESSAASCAHYMSNLIQKTEGEIRDWESRRKL